MKCPKCNEKTRRTFVLEVHAGRFCDNCGIGFIVNKTPPVIGGRMRAGVDFRCQELFRERLYKIWWNGG